MDALAAYEDVMSAAESPAESIYFAALARESPQERAAYLDEACGVDAELRRRVERLLQAQPKVGRFLQDVAAVPQGTVAQPEERETIGAVIGPYKLLEQIGEGGMGTVWMAQQTEPVKRVVALKVIKAGMDSKQVIARFEAERQALALMDHAHIARVLDAGTTVAGRPYFVMDLVKGVPITHYCDEHRLTPRQRLELFLPVCQAVQHAHQKGIIHRDLKPSNVLVALYDGKPVPKVIDFGVAKAAGASLTDKTLVTGFGNIVGTLEYMSPEQAEVNQLDIDTRSDIYSLGVLLYELLAGSPPFTRKELEKAGMLEMLRVIREQEPSKPSTKLSSSDALPTLSANRGTEPAKLTRLVRGELDWIVMKALEKDRNRRYETANGFAMDVQRYLADEPVLACPPSVGYRLRKFARRNKAVLVTAALILIAITVVAGSVGWIINDRQAQQRMTEREVENAVVEAERLQGEARWAEALSWLSRAEGVLAHGAGNDDLRQRVQSLRADLEMVAALEEIRLKTEEDLRVVFQSKDPAYEKVCREYGIDVMALDAAEAAKRIQARSIHDHLTDALYDWLISASQTQKIDHLWTVLGLADPDEWRNALRTAVWRGDFAAQRQLAAQPEFARLRPYTAAFLGRQFHNRGETAKALELFLAVQQRHPDDYWINHTLGWCYATMQPPRLDQAIRFKTATVALRPRSSAARVNLGVTLWESGAHDEAIACYRKAIELNPKNFDAHNNLGNTFSERGKFEAALDCYRKAIGLNPEYAIAHYNIGNLFARQGKLDDAVAWYRKSIAFEPHYVSAHNNLGATLYRQGKLEEAIAACQKAIKLDPNHASAHDNLGWALQSQGKLEEAVACWRKAIELEPSPKLKAGRYFQIGKALEFTKGKLGEAIACFEKAIELDPKWAYAHEILAWVLTICPDVKLRNPRRGLEVARKAVELATQSGLAWQMVGWASYRTGDWKASIEALEKSCALQSDSGGDAFQWFFLAMAHWQLGEKDRARQWYDRAVAWMDRHAPNDGNLRSFRAEAAELGLKEEK
jgi:tetratricopeptide (TPR) repeat protein/serine/threonine protein kinase